MVSETLQSYYPDESSIAVKNGLIIVGSDFHIWPGEESTCLRAFKLLCKELKPAAVILNGDVLDFPQISRHPPMGWEKIPSPQEEIEAAQYHLHDIEQAAPKGCKKAWTLGNHDFRFEQRLATIAREYKGVKGIHLSDHFNPCWQKCWGIRINDNMAKSDAMIVAMMDTWEISKGIRHEIETFVDAGKPVFYLDPRGLSIVRT